MGVIYTPRQHTHPGLEPAPDPHQETENATGFRLAPRTQRNRVNIYLKCILSKMENGKSWIRSEHGTLKAEMDPKSSSPTGMFLFHQRAW